MPLENLVIIGKISKPQGLRGEVRLWLDSISGEVLRELKKVILEYPSGKSNTLFISKAEPHKDFIKVKFRSIETRNDAETLRDCIVKIPKSELPVLPKGDYYDFDLIDLQVFTDEGILLGVLIDVLHLPANDVYVINRQEDGQEFLIPAIDDIILDVDLERKKMIIFPMEGLLDI